MTIGEKIVSLRKEKGLTQDQLAEKLFVTQKTISSWEVGRTLPSIEDIINISNLFNIKVDDVLKNSEIKEEYHSETKKRKLIMLLYLIVLLIVPVLYFNYAHNFGYKSLVTKFVNNNLTKNNIYSTYYNVIRGVTIEYILYFILLIINFLVYIYKSNKSLIILSVIELLVILVLLFPYNFLSYQYLIFLVAPITNFILLSIKRKSK